MIQGRKLVAEVILVIIVCAVFALLIFITLKPTEKLSAIYDRQRLSQINALMNALFQRAFGNHGVFPKFQPGIYYLIGKGNDASGCSRQPTTAALDLSRANCGGGETLVPDYISAMPVETLGSEWSQKKTGFYLIKSKEGKITIGACDVKTEKIEVTH